MQGDRDYGSHLSGIIPNDVEKGKSLLDGQERGGHRETRMYSMYDTPILDGYLWGQLANVCKYGIWWFSFSPTVFCLFGGDAFAVGLSRFLFNIALFVIHPLTSHISSALTAKSIINISTFLRLLIYSVMLPASWLVLRTDVIWDSSIHSEAMEFAFYIAFMALIFTDGMVVAFANIADIDCGGTDLMADQHRIYIDDSLRTRFSFLHVLTFEGSLILLAPAIAFIGAVIHFYYGSFPDSLLLLLMMGSVFLVFSCISLIQYNLYIPSLERVPQTPQSGPAANIPRICESLRVTWEFKPIFWRLWFVGLETAFEDVMISIIIAEFALFILEGKTDFDYVNSNFYANLLAAFARLGSVLTAFAMKSWWKSPELDFDSPQGIQPGQERNTYRPMFKLAFLSGCSALLLPLAHYLNTEYQLLQTSIALSFAGSFLFFSFSTAPKIAFQTLLNDLAFHADESGNLLAFIGTFVTLCDSVILLLSAALFGYLEFETALLILTSAMALLGLVELIAGPALVLPSSYGSLYDGYYTLD